MLDAIVLELDGYKARGDKALSGKKTLVSDVFTFDIYSKKVHRHAWDTRANYFYEPMADLLKAFVISYLLEIYGKENVKGANPVKTWNPLRLGERADTDDNPVIMSVHVQSLKLDVRMKYYYMSERFEVQCCPLDCDNDFCCCCADNFVC